MNSIIYTFYVLSFIAVLIIGLIIYIKIPNKSDKLRFIIPVLIGIIIAAIFYMFGLIVPSCKFGRFM